MNFYQKYKAGLLELEAIHDYIEEWFLADSGESINEFLGITRKQYFKWMETKEL